VLAVLASHKAEVNQYYVHTVCCYINSEDNGIMTKFGSVESASTILIALSIP